MCTSVSTRAASREPSGCSRRSSTASTVLQRGRGARKAGGCPEWRRRWRRCCQHKLGSAARVVINHGRPHPTGGGRRGVGGAAGAHSGDWDSANTCSMALGLFSRRNHSAIKPVWKAHKANSPPLGSKAVGGDPRACTARCKVVLTPLSTMRGGAGRRPDHDRSMPARVAKTPPCGVGHCVALLVIPALAGSALQQARCRACKHTQVQWSFSSDEGGGQGSSLCGAPIADPCS